MGLNVQCMQVKAKMDVDFWEMIWFVGVTVAINCLVFLVCGLLELVERYGLFQDAKIQKKVAKSGSRADS